MQFEIISVVGVQITIAWIEWNLLYLFLKIFLINFDQSYEQNDSWKFYLLFDSATSEFWTVWNLLFSVSKVLKFKVCLMF